MAAKWQKTADGIESHFQNNYLAYFVLVNALLEIMLPGSRVVLMTTSIRRDAPAPTWEDINFAVSWLEYASFYTRQKELFGGLGLICCAERGKISLS